MRVLVAGGTGSLRPAVGMLIAQGHRVGLLSRSAERAREVADGEAPGQVVAIVADWGDADSLARALAGSEFDAAVLYAPTAEERAIAVLAAATNGPVIQLMTSRHADPAVNPDVDPAMLRATGTPLLLGWTDGRWHTPAEISRAALAVLDDPRPAVLGHVRPWTNQPR